MNLHFISHDSMTYICKLMTHVPMSGTFIQAASILFIFNENEHSSPPSPIAKAVHVHCCALFSTNTVLLVFQSRLVTFFMFCCCYSCFLLNVQTLGLREAGQLWRNPYVETNSN